jgi:hypothetical protein
MKPAVDLRKRKVVPNRIFLAYQWHTYRPLYERACQHIHKVYPVYFFAIGRPPGQPAMALMEKIESVLLSSSQAVFDASRGNANVSLEYGLAKFTPHLETFLLIDQTQMPTQVSAGTPIISDLAGATQNHWDITKPDTLRAQLRAIADKHPYNKRFRRYCRTRRLQRAQYRTPLKVIRLLDERESILRRELVDELAEAWPRKPEGQIEALLKDMHKAALLTITRGREWASRVSIA